MKMKKKMERTTTTIVAERVTIIRLARNLWKTLQKLFINCDLYRRQQTLSECLLCTTTTQKKTSGEYKSQNHAIEPLSIVIPEFMRSKYLYWSRERLRHTFRIYWLMFANNCIDFRSLTLHNRLKTGKRTAVLKSMFINSRTRP